MSARRSSENNMGKLKSSSSVKFNLLNSRFNPYDTRTPKGRSGHCVCGDESDIYVFGGYSPSDERNGVRQSKVLPELWKFNFASHEWIKVQARDNPITCASSSLAVHNKQVFVFGGTGYPFGQIMSNTMKTLKLNKQPNLQAAGENANDANSSPCWQLLETNPMSYSAGTDVEDLTPPPAYGQSLIFHKDAIYVFGGAVGYYSEAVADLHKLSIHTMTWEKLRPTGKIPTGRYKQEIARDSQRFYVLGGGRLHHAESLNNIYIYDIARNHWTETKTEADPVHGYPKSRCSFGCAQEGKNIYVSGGRHYGATTEHEPLSDMWHLHLDTMIWRKMELSLPQALYFHGTVVSPAGMMYIFGGVHKDGFRSPNLYKVRLPYTVPKLAEMCWENMCEITREQKIMNPKHLAELGIPWNFIERVQSDPRGNYTPPPMPERLKWCMYNPPRTYDTSESESDSE